MQNFQETFETPKSSSINAFLICMTVPLRLGFPDHSNGLEDKHVSASEVSEPYWRSEKSQISQDDQQVYYF